MTTNIYDQLLNVEEEKNPYWTIVFFMLTISYFLLDIKMNKVSFYLLQRRKSVINSGAIIAPCYFYHKISWFVFNEELFTLLSV